MKEVFNKNYKIFIQAEVENLHANYLEASLVENGQKIKIDFDFCIIASGSNYRNSIKPSQNDLLYSHRKQIIQNQIDVIKSQYNGNFVVFGGGFIGVELAGELASLGKKVTIVTRSNTILSGFSSQIQEKVKSALKQKNVEFHCGVSREMYLKENPTEYQQFGFECNGNKYSPNFMWKNFNDYLDQEGRILVNEYLQIVKENKEGVIDNIFAMGDCMKSYFNEEKVILAVLNAVDTIFKNIQILLNNSSKKKQLILQQFRKPVQIFIISLGGKDAIMVYKKLAIRGYVAYVIKKIIEKISISEIRDQKIGILLSNFMHYSVYLMGKIF